MIFRNDFTPITKISENNSSCIPHSTAINMNIY